jgi:anti-sigma factor RsiW
VGIPIDPRRTERAAVIELHKAHAPLNQPPRQQAVPPKASRQRLIEAIKRLRFARLLLKADGFWNAHLHLGGQFIRTQPGRQRRIERILLGHPTIHLLQRF